MEKIKLLELFGGIGACTQAFKRLGIPFEIADYVEIDKYAVKSYNAINDTNFEPQDITKWDKDIEVDFIMHRSPCQDFSIAGKQAGGDENSGTRSSLMYETLRIVNKLKPKYVLWENVKNVISKKHKHNFDNYINIMNEYGYTSFYKVLNAKEYGIPQNRERVFILSIRKDLNIFYEFPKPEELKLKLKDMLESEVDKKYYLSDKAINGLTNQMNKKHKPNIINIENEPYKIFSTITCGYMKQGHYETYIEIKNANKKGYDIAIDGDSINLQQPNSTTRRGRVGHQISSTLQCADTIGVVEQLDLLRIRKLTPKECYRLMGFSDESFEKAEKVNSNTQLYKQAGNSIVVDVLEKILKNLFKEE